MGLKITYIFILTLKIILMNIIWTFFGLSTPTILAFVYSNIMKTIKIICTMFSKRTTLKKLRKKLFGWEGGGKITWLDQIWNVSRIYVWLSSLVFKQDKSSFRSSGTDQWVSMAIANIWYYFFSTSLLRIGLMYKKKPPKLMI